VLCAIAVTETIEQIIIGLRKTTKHSACSYLLLLQRMVHPVTVFQTCHSRAIPPAVLSGNVIGVFATLGIGSLTLT
jgi:hypothetical protein